jgi:hypothetical protein
MDRKYGENKWTDDKKVTGAKKWYRRRKAIIEFIRLQKNYTLTNPGPALEAALGLKCPVVFSKVSSGNSDAGDRRVEERSAIREEMGWCCGRL